MTGPRGIVLVTDRWQANRPLDEVVGAAVDGGVRWVLLRERDLPRPERLDLARRLRALLAPVHGTLLVAGPDPLDGGAVHLPAAGPYPPPALPLVGRSCHDLAELGRLTTEDYVTISPLFPSPSKPGYGPPLGTAGLAGLVADSPVPVLALGGVATPDQVTACLAAGAAGVAVMGALMRADDPAGLSRELCAVASAGSGVPAVACAEPGVPAGASAGSGVPAVPTAGTGWPR
ncbi:thiamine phosphate synthase [Micromonospora sp. WMMD1102]|uniref:thiamine phosphate synthase n=1 Tax=Micromonospora sp. WMMD1102 TaxID=3016105 RepID=UPI0024153D73|nr:thiamine phosphate synthase [Micromonospora sp. WMMD1102]MDG4789922.1 thiamine phosphate synthase [Micromonospora sp. WMMD1102]